MEVDSALRSYRARARGHVYFLMDRDDAGQRTLVKADQLALEVFWKAPGQVRQEIVGRRAEKRLPTDIRYHLDHLTVVTDDFGDRMTLGQGDEVQSVPHPLAPASERVYEFSLGDSLTVSFPGAVEPVRVYEVRVRPRDFDRPAVVGSVFLDRSTAAVVRMTFTFTPASYVDPYLDHIRVALRNSLWQGRFWLPYRQEIEIRREFPYLDVPAGSVIRARYEIGNYEFNPDLPPGFFSGPEVTTPASPSELESFPFEEGLYAPIDEEGLAPTPDLEEVRREARQVATDRYLSGLGPVRPWVPSASSVVRYNRAEGLRLGGGVSYRATGSLDLRLHGGYAFGAERPDLELEALGREGRSGTGARIEWNRMQDLGPVPAASRTVNSLAAAALETDYLDPYFSTGLELFHRIDLPGSPALDLSAELERHSSAENVVAGTAGSPGSLRPVVPVDEGTGGTLTAALSAGADRGLSAATRFTVGRFEDDGWAEATGRLRWSRRWPSTRVRVGAEARAGILTSAAPLQTLYQLGGRGTVPGYGYREHAGDRFWLVQLAGSLGLASPWLRPRAFAAAGGTGLAGRDLPDSWARSATFSPLVSVGLGVGLFWDVLRVDLARGLNGGDWEWNVTVNQRFWPFL